MFKVWFWFQINNISYSLETKIQVVILMAKYESLLVVIRELQRRRMTNIPERPWIRVIEKFSQKILNVPTQQRCPWRRWRCGSVDCFQHHRAAAAWQRWIILWIIAAHRGSGNSPFFKIAARRGSGSNFLPCRSRCVAERQKSLVSFSNQNLQKLN